MLTVFNYFYMWLFFCLGIKDLPFPNVFHWLFPSWTCEKLYHGFVKYAECIFTLLCPKKWTTVNASSPTERNETISVFSLFDVELRKVFLFCRRRCRSGKRMHPSRPPLLPFLTSYVGDEKSSKSPREVGKRWGCWWGWRLGISACLKSSPLSNPTPELCDGNLRLGLE